MELVQAQSQKQTQVLSGQMLNSLAILGMASSDLSDYLQEQAHTNPFLSYRRPRAFVAQGGEAFDRVAALAADRPSLMAHVAEQIELSSLNEKDRLIALRFAEALEPTGWLGQPVSAIAMHANVGQRRAENVLEVLQQFEPSGLFARSLAECLKIQARDADILTWEVKSLLDNLHLVAAGRMTELAELCDCDVEDIPDILAQIRTLNPKPGLAFEHAPAPVFPPDLIATKGARGWTVELNRAASPTIEVHEDRLPDGSTDPEARNARRKALAEARAVVMAVERRGDTLLRTAAVLVARQAAFLEQGPGHLAPLTREDVAEELGVHASTISRAVSGRMIQTPTHALPLKAFFSRPVGADGDAVSRDSAMEFVSRTIRDEDPTKPLGDDAIVALATKEGLQIARRTVAKYRAILGLGSSYERRRRATETA